MRKAGLRHRRPAGRLSPRLHRAEARHAGHSRPDARAPLTACSATRSSPAARCSTCGAQLHLLAVARAAQRARRGPGSERRDGARHRHLHLGLWPAERPGEEDPRADPRHPEPRARDRARRHQRMLPLGRPLRWMNAPSAAAPGGALVSVTLAAGRARSGLGAPAPRCSRSRRTARRWPVSRVRSLRR